MSLLNSLWAQKAFRPYLVILAVLVVLVVFGSFKYFALSQEFKETTTVQGNKISELETNITKIEFERTNLSDALSAEQKKSTDLEQEVDELSSRLGTLKKLSRLDPELLQKYSKVYFLNEHYGPERLVEIDNKYVLNTTPQQIHARVWPFLEDLLQAAKKTDLDLRVVSGYRSFDTQTALKTNYKVIYGYGANQFSADQGYSEHQLGTTVDFSDQTVGQALNGFESSEAYTWLTKNAYKYGFILSYPKNNVYYQYEPWHWRFVGIKLAKKLQKENTSFYDLEQREIDSYLINIFDN